MDEPRWERHFFDPLQLSLISEDYGRVETDGGVTAAQGTLPPMPSTDPPYSKRVDPDEPWRYECPACGSVQVLRVYDGKRPRGKTYPQGGEGKNQAERDRSRLDYRCKECYERFEAVIDRKTGELAKP